MVQIINNIEYDITDDNIKAGDLFLINNPHPLSSLKNRIFKCSFIHDDGEIQPEGDLVIRKWNPLYCKKAIRL